MLTYSASTPTANLNRRMQYFRSRGVLQIPVEPEFVISYFAPLLAVPTPHLSLLLQLKDDPNVVKLVGISLWGIKLSRC
jgi:hypothetical protein